MKLYSVFYNIHICSSSGISVTLSRQKQHCVYHSGPKSLKHCTSFKQVTTNLESVCKESLTIRVSGSIYLPSEFAGMLGTLNEQFQENATWRNKSNKVLDLKKNTYKEDIMQFYISLK